MKNLFLALIAAVFTTTAYAQQGVKVLNTPGFPVPVAENDTAGTLAALGALNATASVAMAGQQGAGLTIAAGTLIGTVTPEVSYDYGVSPWTATSFWNTATQTASANVVFASANPVTTLTIVVPGGVTNVRVRVSAYTSGTANATVRATSATTPLIAPPSAGLPVIVPTAIQGGTVGSAPPGGANYAMSGWNVNNLVAIPHICGSSVFKHITTATDTQLVAASGSTTIYVCDYALSFNGTTNIFLEKATTGTCATTTQIDGAWYGIVNAGKTAANAFYRGLNTGASAQLCANTSGAATVDITVYYDQY